MSTAATATARKTTTRAPNRRCSRSITGAQQRNREVDPDEPERTGDRLGGQRVRAVRPPDDFQHDGQHRIAAHHQHHRRQQPQHPRPKEKSAVVPPRRRIDRSVTACENPPTKKNSGMTCQSHVTSCAGKVFAIATPLCANKSAMNQWPITTAPIENTRRKSTYLSRSFPVAAASAAALGTVVVVMSSGCRPGRRIP